jgi:glycolate oxidase
MLACNVIICIFSKANIEGRNMTESTKLVNAAKFLRSKVGKSNVSEQPFVVSESCLAEVTKKVFGMGKTYLYLIARPGNVGQIQQIVRYASRNGIPIFVRGSGTGYFGGEIPTQNGITIETTALVGIKEFNREIGYVVCEAGTSVIALNQYLRKRDYYWPHNPGSRMFATVGGSLASLGVGTFSTRYGYATDSVLSLKVITPTGAILETGSNIPHDMSSLNLIQLICSSEGTLGIIIEAKLKIFRIPEARKASIFLFKKIADAVVCASEILRSGICPESLEIEDLSRFTSEGIAPVMSLKDPRIQRLHLDRYEAILFLNNAGSRDQVSSATSQIEAISNRNNGKKIADEKLTSLYWKSKTEISSWAANKTPKKKVHTFVPAVPLSKVPVFEKCYLEIARKYTRITPVGVGYFVIFRNEECTVSARTMLDETDPKSIREYEDFVSDLAGDVVKMGGAIASTFGLGTILAPIAKKNAPSRSWYELSLKLKMAVDPNGIMSPGKKF